MNMEKVRFGLVGCGSYARMHLFALRGVRAAEVTAVFDVDQGRARAVAEEFGIGRVCKSLEEICQLPNVDAIDVLTPESAHLAPVLAALAGKKHVLIEKPMATDLDHCTSMIAAAREAGRILMVGHIVRFEIKYALLKEEIASGRLGDVVSLHARRNRAKALLPTYSRVHPAVEHCVHDIDIMLWCVGKPVKKVRGFGRKVTGGPNHDTFWGILEFEGGAIGVVETIWLLPAAAGIALDDQFQVVGTKGVGNLALLPGPLTFWRDDGFFVPDVSYDPIVGGVGTGALHRELTYFTECVLTGRAPVLTTPLDAKRAVRVGLALIESANSERDVEIKEWD